MTVTVIGKTVENVGNETAPFQIFLQILVGKTFDEARGAMNEINEMIQATFDEDMSNMSVCIGPDGDLAETDNRAERHTILREQVALFKQLSDNAQKDLSAFLGENPAYIGPWASPFGVSKET